MNGIYKFIILATAIFSLIPGAWAAVKLPARGLPQSTVESSFGTPRSIEGPVGQPPITKWIYNDFIVIFEYDHVVHAHERDSQLEQRPQATDSPPATTGDTLEIPQ